MTSDPSPVQGCVVERLGTLRYTPAAAPDFAERWRRGRGYDWARMPVVVFNEKDALQHDVLAARGVTEPPPVVHRVPTSHDFHEAVRAGLGWAVIPDPQLLPDLEAGRLVVLAPREHVDVELHWQRWRLDSPALDRLTELVRRPPAPVSGLVAPLGDLGRAGHRPRAPAQRDREHDGQHADQQEDPAERVAGDGVVDLAGRSTAPVTRISPRTRERCRLQYPWLPVPRSPRNDADPSETFLTGQRVEQSGRPQKAASSRSISDRSVAWAMASSALILGRLVCAKNCAAATLPS